MVVGLPYAALVASVAAGWLPRACAIASLLSGPGALSLLRCGMDELIIQLLAALGTWSEPQFFKSLISVSKLNHVSNPESVELIGDEGLTQPIFWNVRVLCMDLV